MASQVLPDGSEKGLSGYNTERMPRRRIGLAPRAGEIDRNAPYKRIATEEAWTFRAGQGASRLPGKCRMRWPILHCAWGMFAANQNLQRMLQDVGELRIAHMDEYGIDRQLLLLTAPGVQVPRPGDGPHWRGRPTTSLPTRVAGTRTGSRPVRRSIRAMSRARSPKSSAR